MSLIFENTEHDKAGCHVLLIGVAEYPFLRGGREQMKGKNPSGLPTLTSPNYSARAMADWFLGKQSKSQQRVGFFNPEFPLSSVEMLLSPADRYLAPTGKLSDIEEPNKQNICDAFARWCSKLMNQIGSMGVFYFCGHGIEDVHQYLLASDFGHPSSIEWDKAFNIDVTVRALERATTGPLLFIIDACRAAPKTLYQSHGGRPLPLLNLNFGDYSQPSGYATIIHGTGVGQKAWGEWQDVSRLTRAMLKALEGHCGSKVRYRDEWGITVADLALATHHILEKENSKYETPQFSHQDIGRLAVFHVNNEPPKVLVKMDLVPPDKAPNYRMYLQQVGGQRVEGPFGTPLWETSVRPGSYEIGANSTDGIHFVKIEEEDISLPMWDYQIDVQRL